MGNIQTGIRDVLDEVKVIDTHEHLSKNLRRAYSIEKNGMDLFKLFKDAYVKDDFGSAGLILSEEEIAESDASKNWQTFKNYIPKVKNTAYFKALIMAVNDLYDLEVRDITEENWQEVNSVMIEKSQNRNWWRYVLKDKGNLDVAILDHAWDVADFSVDRE